MLAVWSGGNIFLYYSKVEMGKDIVFANVKKFCYLIKLFFSIWISSANVCLLALTKVEDKHCWRLSKWQKCIHIK